MKTCPKCGGPNSAKRISGVCYACKPRQQAVTLVVPVGMAVRPTAALPGTPAKVAELMARYAAGVELHHPDDCRL